MSSTIAQKLTRFARWTVLKSTAILAYLLLAVAVTPPTARGQSEDVESIIVTAERRSSPTQDVPIAMSALLSDSLEAAGIADMTGLARHIPALDLQSNSGVTTTSLHIRRVGNIGNIPTFEPAVAVRVDGSFRSRTFISASDLLAVERVEVLRGPQTAMYGRNASAGLVAIHTRPPGEQFSVRTNVTAGRISTPVVAALTDMEIDLSGPIAPNLAAGIAARKAQHDHTLRNVLVNGLDGDDGDRVAARGQLSWRPGSSVVRLLAGYVREDGDQGETDVFLAPGAGSTQMSGALQALGLTPSCSDNVPRNRHVCSVATNKLSMKATDVTLLGEYPLRNGWRLQSVTGLERYEILRVEDDAIQLFAPIFFYHDPEEGVSRQQEITIESDPGSAVRWLAGIFYYRSDYTRGDGGRSPMFGPNGELAFHDIWSMTLGIPLAADRDQLGFHSSTLDTRYASVFGQSSWDLTSKLALTARLRWQTEEKQAVINNSASSPGLSLITAILTPTMTFAGEPVNGRLERTTDDLPWSITPRYRFGRDSMAYFTVARGSRSGGFNTGFGDASLREREYDDETIRHYELGAKMMLGERRIPLQVAAFRTRYDDYQDAAFVSTQFSVGNAARVDLTGMEIDATMQLRERLSIDFAVSYADLRYATHTNGLCRPGRPPDGSSQGCVLSGEHPINAPEWQTHLAVQYSRTLKDVDLFFRADWSWTDQYNTSFSVDPRLVQSAHSDLAARIGLRINPFHEVVLWGNNLLDESVSQYDLLLNLFNDASYQSYLSAPRSYGLTWKYRL